MLKLKRIINKYLLFLVKKNKSIYKTFLKPTDLTSVGFKEAEEMYKQYYNAITRHCNYVLPYSNFISMVTAENKKFMGVYKYKHSYIHGFWKYNMFCVSHFSPYSLREGVEMIIFIQKRYKNILFAVPKNLANQLAKLNYNFQLTCYRPFGDDLVLKYIYTSSPEVYFH